MFKRFAVHHNESGQTALETAIILIAFVVIASVFAFTILSAGSSSTEKGEEAIYAGLEGVQSTMAMRGAVIAQSSAGTAIDSVTFTVNLVSGGDPLDLTDTTGSNVVVIGYRDNEQFVNSVDWAVNWIVDNDGGTADNMLEEGELAEITVDLSGLSPALGANTDFSLEVKPPVGAVLNINRHTPASVETVMELR